MHLGYPWTPGPPASASAYWMLKVMARSMFLISWTYSYLQLLQDTTQLEAFVTALLLKLSWVNPYVFRHNCALVEPREYLGGLAECRQETKLKIKSWDLEQGQMKRWSNSCLSEIHSQPWRQTECIQMEIVVSCTGTQAYLRMPRQLILVCSQSRQHGC